MNSPDVATAGKWLLRWRLPFLLAVVVAGVSLDQWTKDLARNHLATSQQLAPDEDGNAATVYRHSRTVEVVPNFFNLIYRENAAAAFSLTRSFPDEFRRPFLLVVSSLAMIFILAWYFTLKQADGLLLSAFALITTGALGNYLDRLRLGYVVDFLDVHAGFLGYAQLHWPTFNVADSCIVAGAIGVVLRTLRPLDDENKEPGSTRDDSPTSSIATDAGQHQEV